MNEKLAQLAFHRAELRETIADQRSALNSITQDLQRPLAIADMGFRAVRFIREHPVLVTGSVTGLLTLRRSGLPGLIKHGWRMVVLYPSAFFLGLKFLATAKNSMDGDAKCGESQPNQPPH